MSRLDIIYLFMLIASIPLGHVLKSIPAIGLKRCICLGAGLSIVISLVGLPAMYHSLVVIVFNYATLKLVSHRFCHHVSFLLVFGYLLFFRSCVYLGFQAPPKHANAVQLLVTLRMVSMAFEKHRDVLKTVKSRQMHVVKEFSVTFIDTLVYGYCYIGLMTGPFYSYQTFQDMLHQDGSKIITVKPALWTLKLLPVLALPYLYLKGNFPLEFLESEEFLENKRGFLYSLMIVALTTVWFRLRFYIGWLLAESSCITASLGAYPFESQPTPGKGPTVFSINNDTKKQGDNFFQTHSFKTIENIVVKDIIFAPTMKYFIKNWNKTVQWWLSSYINQLYSGNSKTLRTLIVFTISAYWHGTYSGYYVMALLVAIYVHLEGRCAALLKKKNLSKEQETKISWLLYFLFGRFIEFVIMPFMLLRLDKILRVWAKLHYFGFFILAFLYVLPGLFSTLKAPSDPQGENNSKGRGVKTE